MLRHKGRDIVFFRTGKEIVMICPYCNKTETVVQNHIQSNEDIGTEETTKCKTITKTVYELVSRKSSQPSLCCGLQYL